MDISGSMLKLTQLVDREIHVRTLIHHITMHLPKLLHVDGSINIVYLCLESITLNFIRVLETLEASRPNSQVGLLHTSIDLVVRYGSLAHFQT